MYYLSLLQVINKERKDMDEMIILGVLAQMTGFILPVFKIIISFYANRHLKGLGSQLMLISSIFGLSLAALDIWFNLFFIQQYYRTDYFQVILIAKAFVAMLIAFTFVLGVFLVLKQAVKNRRTPPDLSEHLLEKTDKPVS